MNFIVDEEIGLTEENDILETKRYAESLKDTILNAPTPFNIGLYGEWGSGKSSIIKTAQTQLEANQDQKIKFVVYDAWKYANDSFRRMFLKTLQEQLKFDGTNFFDSFYQNTTQDKKIEQKFNLKYLLLIFGFGSLVIFLTLYNTKPEHQNFVITLQSILTVITILIAFFKNAFTDYKVTLSKPAMFAPEQFEDAFKDMMSKSLKKYNIFSLATEYVKGNYYEKNIDKLVIVVDNIDRCDKKTAYELLTNIKNFIGKEKGIIFLVPVDDEALKRHMREHNKENSKEADEFLRKFFNTTIKIKHFQPRDLFEFANKLNSKNQLGFKPDTINIVAKEYASNPRRIIQLFNNLTSELKTIESKYEKLFVEEHQSLIARLLIIREEWADVFKEITKHPHKFTNFDRKSLLDTSSFFADEAFNFFMNRTKAITSDVKTIEKIVLNITNESTLPNELIRLIENNKFKEVKDELEKGNIVFESIVKYAIEELRKGVNRETFSTDARNGLMLLSNLNEYKVIEKSSLNDMSGFFNVHYLIIGTLECFQADELDTFFKFVEQNRTYELNYLQDKIIEKFKESWTTSEIKEELKSIWKDGVDKFINNTTDENAIKDLQSIFVNYYNYFSYSPLYKDKWINEDKLHLIVSSKLITHIINKIVPPIIDIKSDAYLELEYLAVHKIITIENLEKVIEKIKPNFSQQITVQADANGEKQRQINNIFINIQAIINLLKKVERDKYKSEIISSYIIEFFKNVDIRQNGYSHGTLNLLADISQNIEYQEKLLNFYLEIYKATYNNTNVTGNIQSLIKRYPQLKDFFYQKLVELRDTYQMSLMPLLDYLLQQDKDKNLFNLYEKLFNRNDISPEQIEQIKRKLNGYIDQLISSQNEDVEDFINKLILESKTQGLLTDIIISKKTQDIIKLPQNIKKVSYSYLCANNKIFDIENNIEAISDVVETSDEYNDCILNIITRKLANPQEVGDALSIINKMKNMNDEIKKEILSGLNKQKKHNKLSDEVIELIKKLTPSKIVKK